MPNKISHIFEIILKKIIILSKTLTSNIFSLKNEEQKNQIKA